MTSRYPADAAGAIQGYGPMHPVNQDYRKITADMTEAYRYFACTGERAGDPYGELFVRASQFAEPVARDIEACLDDVIDGGLSFRQLGALASEHIPRAVRLHLGDPRMAERTSRTDNVFDAFTGHWRGGWNDGRQVTICEHDWQPTGYMPNLHHGENIMVQPVVMGPYNGGQAMSTGVNSNAPQAAANAVDVRTGIILGAVMSSKPKASGERDIRRHVGYRVNGTTLLWVAQENDTGLYSVLFEHKNIQTGRYEIRGVQCIWWNDKYRFIKVIGGSYTHPHASP